MAKQKRKVNVEMPGLEDFEIPPDAPPETADMMKLLQKAYADPEGLSEEEFNAFMGIANALSEAEDAAIAPEDREKAAALGAQAFELWQAGEVDEAFDKANDALDLNPSEPTADLVNAVLSIESDQEAFEAMAAISMQVEFELRRENDDRRTDLLEEIGAEPPNTYEELIAASEAIQEQTDVPWGYVWQGLQYEGLITNFVEIISGYGGFWVDPDTFEVGLDQPPAIQAVEFMKTVIQQGITPPGVTNFLEEDSLRVFENGNAAFLRNWPYVWAEANKEESPVQGKIALKPMVHAPDENPAACLGGWGFGISATTPHPEEAWQVVEYFTSREAVKQFVMEYAYVPSHRALFNDADILDRYPHYQQLLEVAETTVPRPPIGQYAQLSDILQRYLSAAITDQMPPKVAMEAAAGETRRVLGRFDREGG